MVCESELGDAITCIANDASCSMCWTAAEEGYYSIVREIVEEAENSFRYTLAFKLPSDPEFCSHANNNVCDQFASELGGRHSCCCNDVNEAYIRCEFDNEWMTKYWVNSNP